MTENIYKTIELENKETLVIHDLSRKIGQDAYVVLMKATIEVKIKKELFSQADLADKDYNEVIQVLGDKVSFEHLVERNFIMAPDKDAVFESLVETFMNNLGPYVSKQKFPTRLILKEFQDQMDS